jgi:hypothetical protein
MSPEGAAEASPGLRPGKDERNDDKPRKGDMALTICHLPWTISHVPGRLS